MCSARKGTERSGSSRETLSHAQTPATDGGSVSAGANLVSSGLWDGLSDAQTLATTIGCRSADTWECRDEVAHDVASRPSQSEVANPANTP